MCIQTYTCINVCLYIPVYIYIHTLTYTYVRTYTHTYVQACTPTYIHVCVHVCTSTHSYIDICLPIRCPIRLLSGTGTELVLELVFVFSECGVPVYDSLKSYTYVDLCTCIHTNVSSTHPAVCGGPCQIRTTNMYI